MDSSRVHLGYDTCIKCSDTEKFHMSCIHTNNGIVHCQEDTKRNIQRLDRRSSNGGRTAKGIFADNSWDRWLESYYAKYIINNQRKNLSKNSKFLYMESKTLYHEIVRIFINEGYHQL